MKLFRKLVAILCAAAVLTAYQSVPVMAASAEGEFVEALLYVKHSKLIIEDYANLALAKEDTIIYNEKGEEIAILKTDAAADVIQLLIEEGMYEVVSGDIRGFVKKDALLTEKMAELRAVQLLDELTAKSNAKLVYEAKEITVNQEPELKAFEVSLAGTLAKAELLPAKAEEVSEEEQASDEEAAEKERKKAARVEYTQAELDLLAAIVYCESGNQSFQGKLAVANVILNRVEDSRFPNTIKGVVYAPRQFSPAGNGKLSKILKQKAPEGCYEAALAALEGENNVEGYLYFDGRIHQGGYKKIGAHYFWKKPW